ncbi:regulatory protein UhpC [Rodentibacter pneumotropicus]|uniref:Regulatory protein UhpC n=1 Tax=Rodentibacter pneumotropicus TaxID=758 RepID=A0A448MS92_9PAST|nr:regulatory protein UhpC [Rodentibacter pneumotropicus]
MTIFSSKIDRTYGYWRVHLMIAMYIGYAGFYLTRKSFNFAVPEMITALGIEKNDIGLMATLFYITYGLSKFFSGIFSDKSNPRHFMAIGLIVTGILNIFFGLSNSVLFFTVLWVANAWFQGWGWPACSKLLTSWYSRNERGHWWSVWNTAHNAGGALIPLLIGYVALHYSWRHGFAIAGGSAIFIGFSCYGDYVIHRSPWDYPVSGIGEMTNWNSSKNLLHPI